MFKNLSKTKWTYSKPFNLEDLSSWTWENLVPDQDLEMLCHCFDNINCSFCSRLYAFWFFFYILFHIIAEICSKCILLTPRSRVALSLLWYFKLLVWLRVVVHPRGQYCVSSLLCIMKLSKYFLNVLFWRQAELFLFFCFHHPALHVLTQPENLSVLNVFFWRQTKLFPLFSFYHSVLLHFLTPS